VIDLYDLIEQLKAFGILTFDIENTPPYDDSPNIIKSDLSMNDITEYEFDLLTKTTRHIPYIVPIKKVRYEK